MAKQKDDHERFDTRIGGGRVVDKGKGTVYSPNTIDKMKEESDKARGKKVKSDQDDNENKASQ